MMSKEYYNIKTIHELRHARKQSQRELTKTKNVFSNHKDALMDSMSPPKIITSALGSVMSVVSDVTLIQKGYTLAMSFLDRIFPDKESDNKKGEIRDDRVTDKQN